MDGKEKWLNGNCHISQLIGSGLTPFDPDVGYYIQVNNLDISEEVFPNEYHVIRRAYVSVMEKLDKHYKNGNNKK